MITLLRATPRTRSIIHTAKSFTTSSILKLSKEAPDYPGLYFHSIPSSSSPTAAQKSQGPKFALSFLSTPAPSLKFSPTTIGIISSDDQTTADALPPITPRKFEENQEFTKLLNEVLKDLVEGNRVLETMAKTRPEDGYIVRPFPYMSSLFVPLTSALSLGLIQQHIHDHRTQMDPQRVPDPSDILASILVQNGKLDLDSFEISGTHRLVTIDGMMKLEPQLCEGLKEKLKLVRRVEEEIAKESEGK